MSAARDYLPNAIRELNACFCGGENTIGQRLCTDHRMQQVWKTLTTEGTREAEDREKFERRLNSLPKRYRQETWDPDQSMYGVSLTDRACASFFLATAIVFQCRKPGQAGKQDRTRGARLANRRRALR